MLVIAPALAHIVIQGVGNIPPVQLQKHAHILRLARMEDAVQVRKCRNAGVAGTENRCMEAGREPERSRSTTSFL